MIEDAAIIFTGRGSVVVEDGSSQQLSFGVTTGNLLRVLGAHVVAGRDFNEGDDAPQQVNASAAPGAPVARAPLMAIISYEYWRKRFGLNPNILGHSIGGRRDPIVVGFWSPGSRCCSRRTRMSSTLPTHGTRDDFDTIRRREIASDSG